MKNLLISKKKDFLEHNLYKKKLLKLNSRKFLKHMKVILATKINVMKN